MQDKIVCYICIDLHVMYVFLYLYVMDLKLESGYDMYCARQDQLVACLVHYCKLKSRASHF